MKHKLAEARELIKSIGQATLLGLALTGLLALPAAPILSLWLNLNGVTEDPDIGTRLAFAQVYAGYLALALGISAVVFAVRQFGWELAERLQKPDLRVNFQLERYRVEEKTHIIMNIELENAGSFTPTYYTLRMVFPVVISEARASRRMTILNGPVLGGDRGLWSEATNASQWLLTLVGSEGTLIPAGEKHKIYQMVLVPERIEGQTHTVEYSITSERAKRQTGTAELQFSSPAPSEASGEGDG